MMFNSGQWVAITCLFFTIIRNPQSTSPHHNDIIEEIIQQPLVMWLNSSQFNKPSPSLRHIFMARVCNHPQPWQLFIPGYGTEVHLVFRQAEQLSGFKDPGVFPDVNGNGTTIYKGIKHQNPSNIWISPSFFIWNFNGIQTELSYRFQGISSRNSCWVLFRMGTQPT